MCLMQRSRELLKQCSLVLGIAALLAASAAQASTYTGTVQKIAAQQSPISPTTQTRISIITATAITTACATASTYSFDLSNASVTSVYEAILIAALASNQQVVISGSGICDAAGIEGVGGLWLL